MDEQRRAGTTTGSLATGWLCALAGAMLFVGLAGAAEPAAVLDVWPGKAPGQREELKERLLSDAKEKTPFARLTDVSHPTLSVYRPAHSKDTGTAMVICPGGAYQILAIEHEGTEVAAWLNSIGVTGIVLKYRVPARKDQPRYLAPLQDAQRAVSLVRAKAAQWQLDPKRIGILGFSAGGHLAAAAAANFDRRQYPPLDEVDQVSCRPDFAVLVYPAYLVVGEQLAPEIRVSAETPPVFFAHAADDRISPENSIRMFLALKQAGVPAELHVFASGGHGFGLRPSEHTSAAWPRLCEAWMRSRGLLPKP